MGYDIFAASIEHQSELEAELKSLSLHCTLKCCDIDINVFEYCAGICIHDVAHIDISPEMVKDYAIHCKHIMDENVEIEDIHKIYVYLTTCVKYDCYLIVI